jgi:release factor glutamine methyltransferase
VLDVGTGTGAIALALADEAGADVVALDASAEALALARENADGLGLDVELVLGDLRDRLPQGPFDLVVSNPPYVRAGELDALEREVREWEPRAALVDEGQSSALVRAARDVLRPGAPLVLEAHEAHAEALAHELENTGYDAVRITRDLAGRQRVVEGTKP